MRRLTSIIILSYNTRDLTVACIDSIRKYTPRGSYEIIVIDNASSDDSVSWLKKQNDVRLIVNNDNKGFPAGCNQGLEIAKGTELLLLNSDVLVTPRWLTNMRRVLYSDDSIGAVSCVTDNCSNMQQINVSYRDYEEMEKFAEEFNAKREGNAIPWFTLVGFCLLFKREVFAKVGFLDEMYFPGNYEDDDYCLSIRKAGYRCVLDRGTFIHHHGSASFVNGSLDTEVKTKREKLHHLIKKNGDRFCEKWRLKKDDWKSIHGIYFTVADILKQESSVLMLDVSCTMDMYYLASVRPDLNLTGVTNCKTSYELASMDFTLFYVEDENVRKKIPAVLYDYIILPVAHLEWQEDSLIIQELKSRLKSPTGILYFTDGKRLLEARTTI